jgi:hypothetical protein
MMKHMKLEMDRLVKQTGVAFNKISTDVSQKSSKFKGIRFFYVACDVMAAPHAALITKRTIDKIILAGG